MNIHLGEFVYALRGRDAGKCFIVMSEDGKFLYLCDGKSRKVESNKKKQIKHVSFTGCTDSFILSKLTMNEEVTNNEVKRAVRRYKDGKEI